MILDIYVTKGAKMPAKKKTVVKTTAKKTVKKVASKKVTAKVRKTAADKIEATVSKWDASQPTPGFLKLGTADFLDLLASNLEKGQGVNYESPCGVLAVIPRKPKELLTTVKYLRRQAALGLVKKDK